MTAPLQGEPTAVSSTARPGAHRGGPKDASPRNNVAARTATLSQKGHEARPAAQVFRSVQAGPLPGGNRTGVTTGLSGRQQGHAHNHLRNPLNSERQARLTCDAVTEQPGRYLAEAHLQTAP